MSSPVSSPDFANRTTPPSQPVQVPLAAATVDLPRLVRAAARQLDLKHERVQPSGHRDAHGRWTPDPSSLASCCSKETLRPSRRAPDRLLVHQRSVEHVRTQEKLLSATAGRMFSAARRVLASRGYGGGGGGDLVQEVAAYNPDQLLTEGLRHSAAFETPTSAA